jgi:hypothetical protein
MWGYGFHVLRPELARLPLGEAYSFMNLLFQALLPLRIQVNTHVILPLQHAMYRLSQWSC